MNGPEDDEAQSETDVDEDNHVAGSRASSDDDGAYVGRTFADDSIDAGETGAEARSNPDN